MVGWVAPGMRSPGCIEDDDNAAGVIGLFAVYILEFMIRNSPRDGVQSEEMQRNMRIRPASEVKAISSESRARRSGVGGNAGGLVR